MTVPMFITNVGPAECAKRIQAKGPGFSLSSACATGGHALAVAARLIQSGDADCMVAGGVEACLTRFSVAAFAAMRALSTRNDDPKKASRPFSIDRDGFVISEGGAVFVLEDQEKAKGRGAKVLALLEGIGMTVDAYHMVAPDPEGTSVAYAIERAISEAGIAKTDLGYINAHGTSTPLNDKIETLAIKKTFGDTAYDVPVSSTKSMTGHLLGAAGALEAAFSALALYEGFIPPTTNYSEPDPDCDLDYVPNRARKADLAAVISNSLGFGGHNACLALTKASVKAGSHKEREGR